MISTRATPHDKRRGCLPLPGCVAGSAAPQLPRGNNVAASGPDARTWHIRRRLKRLSIIPHSPFKWSRWASHDVPTRRPAEGRAEDGNFTKLLAVVNALSDRSHARRIHEEAVVKIGSETSAGFSRHPFGIILGERVARERQEMRFGDSHSR